MSQSGVQVAPECVSAFNDLKLSKKIKYIIYKLSDDNKEVVVEETSEDDNWDTFREKLINAQSKSNGRLQKSPRYAVYDFHYELSSGEGQRNKITFIAWSPDDAGIKLKMIYASSKETLKRALTGLAITVTRKGPYRPVNRTGPRLGSWLHDRSRPFVVLDNHGKNLIMFRAKVNRRFSFSGVGNQSMPNSTPQSSFAQENDEDQQTSDLSPMISNSANLMMSAMYTPLDQYVHLTGGQPLGPPEAFYPFVDISADGTIIQDGHSSYDDDEVDSEDMWDIEDFLNFGEASSDEEGANGREEEDDNTSTMAEPPSSTPARPTTASSEDQVHPLLTHFNSGIVGAFRRNQNRHHLLSSNAASRDSLVFSGPYRQGTLRGIKGDRLAAANTPITPLRKRKMPSSNLPSSPASPLATAQQKRKFSGDHSGHKRTRSLF